ncbi:MAG: FeoC-like transcriptional regulator [Pelovirga sp.]|jgi:putative ferrous iron transport protein C
MTPSEVKHYLSDRRIAPLHDIALHFDMGHDAVRGILELWIKKGRVKRHQDNSCKSGSCCGGCEEEGSKEIYEWL